ncbi:ATP-grasp domain-containing protein [Bacillus thuringiensis]|uniref:ATP-grasp domain-containing protein n=1 Tax=Bacillus thuringiensis TaxID=1428 RepID=UPI00301A259B
MKQLATVLILGGASHTQGEFCIEQAHKRGLRVFLTDKEEHLNDFKSIGNVYKTAILDYENPNLCVEWALAHKDENFIGIFGFREYSTLAVAKVAEALGLPGNPPEVVELIRNKYECRKFLKNQGFPQPKIRLCNSWEQAKEFAHHTKESCIVKPVSAMGSLGVTKIKKNSDWDKAAENLKDFKDEFIIETFIVGKEYSVEGIFVNKEPHVLVITEKSTFGNGSFVESGHVVPAFLNERQEEKIRTDISLALSKIGLKHGVFHVECWLNDDTVTIGEVHIRPGGDYIHHMVELVTEKDLYGSVFDQFIGESVNIKDFTIKKGAAIAFIVPPVGKITNISNIKEAQSHPKCRIAHINKKIGDSTTSLLSSYDRTGFVLVSDENNIKARDTAKELVSLIKIEVETSGK